MAPANRWFGRQASYNVFTGKFPPCHFHRKGHHKTGELEDLLLSKSLPLKIAGKPRDFFLLLLGIYSNPTKIPSELCLKPNDLCWKSGVGG